jgi:hypothetical protein
MFLKLKLVIVLQHNDQTIDPDEPDGDFDLLTYFKILI